jgi:hypothetical protein
MGCNSRARQCFPARMVRLTADARRGYSVSMNFFMKSPNNFGMFLLAAWLILFGVVSAPFLKVNFSHSADLLAVLAIAAGVLLILKR